MMDLWGLVKLIAELPCTIDCRDRAPKMSVRDEVVQLCRELVAHNENKRNELLK